MLTPANYRGILCILITGLSLAVSCRSKEPQAARSQVDLSPCDATRKTIKVAKNVTGRVTVLDVSHPNTWVIVSEQGIIGQNSPIYDGPDIIAPCNFPDSLKKYDLRVIFSGELKDSKGELPSGNSMLYYSSLTNIQLTPKN